MSSTTDPSALSADDLLAAYDRSWVARLGTPEERASDDLRAELLRRLAVYDWQRCGSPDPA